MNDKSEKTGNDRPRRKRAAEPAVAPGADAGDVREGERIAKRLARAGLASRREAETMIAEGRVKLNGAVMTSPAVNVGDDDRIEVDGAPLPVIERTRLFLFHKPAGVVTTNRDPEGRRTVFDVLPKNLPRLITIGRLDLSTEGLLLLTNDGGLARVLELPSTGWLRRYRVRVHGQVDAAALEGLKDGIAVDGVFYGSIEASLDRVQGTNAWLTIGLREGKNREVRNILGALNLDVTRLIRLSYGPFQLADLPTGTVREIKGRTLRDQLGERLIKQAGANFDAPIAKPFSEQEAAPRKATVKAEAGGPETKTRHRTEPSIAAGPKSGAKRRPTREEGREAALGRLQTRPPAGAGRGKPAQKDGARKGDPKTDEATGRRTANVWRAPGARPSARKVTGDKPAAGNTGHEGARGSKGSGGKKAEFKKDPNRSFRTKRPTRSAPRAAGGKKGGSHGGKR